MRLSVVVVTQGEPRALPFLYDLRKLAERLQSELVVGTHGQMSTDAIAAFNGPTAIVVPVTGEYLEQMLPGVFKHCTGQFVLRLDDDERCTPAMVSWLEREAYREYDNWHFCRAHLWPDEKHHITARPFWPDYQTRLSIRAKANRPVTLHAGSPYPGRLAPCAVEHYAFLVKSRAERLALTSRYAMLRGAPVELHTPGKVMPEDFDGDLVVKPW